jgi:hypothetical protein
MTIEQHLVIDLPKRQGRQIILMGRALCIGSTLAS